MGILKRMSGLVTANLNDLIDQCEDPEKMLKQAVRDMETALGQLMDGAARAIAHHKLLARQLDEQRDAAERCWNAAEAAVGRGDDDAARSELLRKAEHQRLADALEKQVATADALGQRLRRQVTAMRSNSPKRGGSSWISRPATERPRLSGSLRPICRTRRVPAASGQRLMRCVRGSSSRRRRRKHSWICWANLTPRSKSIPRSRPSYGR